MNLYINYRYEVTIKARMKKSKNVRNRTFDALGKDAEDAANHAFSKSKKLGQYPMEVVKTTIKGIAFAIDRDATEVEFFSREMLDSMWRVDPNNPNSIEQSYHPDLEPLFGEK